MPKPSVSVSFNPPLAGPPKPRSTMSSAEIAVLLRMSTATFDKRKVGLMRAGMPRPVPGLKRLWSRAAILAWIEGTPALAGSIGRHDPVLAHREALEQRMLCDGGVQ